MSLDMEKALDPRRSAVVEACAGSGKTWLLVSRIVRLLIDGTRPGEILAITFTRKAAQEMQQRLHEWLAHLASADDEAVRKFLQERALEGVDAATIARARSLYGELLMSTAGITINTFHGWFMQILKRAPLNAGVPVGMQLLERTSALRDEAWVMLAEQLQREPEGVLSGHMQWLFSEIGLHNTRKLLDNFVGKRAEWWVYARGRDDAVDWAVLQLQEMLEVDELDDPGSVMLASDVCMELQSFASLLESGTESQQKNGAAIRCALEEFDAGKRYGALYKIFMTAEGEPKKNLKATKGQDGELYARLLAGIQDAIDRVECMRVAQDALKLNRAALACGARYLELFQQLKLSRQSMDFTDVEYQVARLMQQDENSEYMQYKLDARYRQVLLDEFQDTNPLQWQVLRAWFSASAAAGQTPQVFIVGDPKQSIYRFRRADARLFGVARNFLEQYFRADIHANNITRRNAVPVLDVVNEVFSGHPEGFDDFDLHEAHNRQHSGHVSVLPLSHAPDELRNEPTMRLRNPLIEKRHESESGAREAEAEIFSDTIRQMVRDWRVQDGEGRWRRAGYGDIMVLVRKRTHLRVYETALRSRNIPYLTSRRGGLLDTLEAEDVQSLLTFLMSPFDDLALAHILRSPIFGCTDHDLILLAQTAGNSWWSRLQHIAPAAPVQLQRASGLLRKWMTLADRLPVHDLLDCIYFSADVQHRYAKAVPEVMRAAVQSNLQALLEVALQVDGGRYPSLPGFLAALRELRKAENESPDEGSLGEAGNAVRIYTVHEAKGLEAPIVWLLDINDSGARKEGYGVLVDWPAEQDRPRHFSLYATQSSRDRKRQHLFEQEEQLDRREDMNLLYVAMTRAKQALVVSGNGKAKESKRQQLSWYERIALCSTEADNPLTGPVDMPQVDESRHAVRIDPALQRSLSAGRRIPEDTQAQQRGTLLHALLQQLTEGGRDVDTDRFKTLHALAENELAALLDTARHILSRPHLARFFDERAYLSAHNEMPYVNAQGQLKRIDRLVEFENEVWVLDYKTGIVEGVREYVEQMEEYRLAMKSAFHNRRIHCGLIAEDGRLLEI